MKTVVFSRAFISERDQLLVNDSESGYRLFGGRVKGKETTIDALRRELREELSEPVCIGDLLRVDERIDKINGVKCRILEFIYAATLLSHSTKVKPNEKGLKPKWVSKELEKWAFSKLLRGSLSSS